VRRYVQKGITCDKSSLTHEPAMLACELNSNSIFSCFLQADSLERMNICGQYIRGINGSGMRQESRLFRSDINPLPLTKPRKPTETKMIRNGGY
jgi:hypothetical protein